MHLHWAGSSRRHTPQIPKLIGADGARLEAFVVKPRIPDKAMLSATIASQRIRISGIRFKVY